MGVLGHLEPKAVFGFFEELCAIPHGSGNTKAVSDYCVAFAKARGLDWRQDESNNVIIFQGGTPGYEQAEPVILQGHLDMVCVKEGDCPLDLEKDGLELAVDGDWVLAKGTTLGGDDGIAVAMALAVLDAKDIPHPPIEAVFTVDEEVGMLGAVELDMSELRGRKLLNIDSEQEGVLTVSCAGGVTVHSSLPVAKESFRGVRCALTIGGGRSGHSGTEIHKGRANTNQLLGRALDALLEKTALRLLSVSGGEKENAITSESAALFLAEDGGAVAAAVAELNEAWRKGYGALEPNLLIGVDVGAVEEAGAMDAVSTRRVADFLHLMPFGPVEFSPDIPGLVQASLNPGILTTEEDGVKITFLLRSSLDTEKALMVSRVKRLTALLGGTVETERDYPAWEYSKESALRQTMTEIFREQYGKEPRVEAVHAGLECGIFCGKLAGLDCVSYGPDLPDIHSPRERLSISSVQRVWEFTKELLKRSK